CDNEHAAASLGDSEMLAVEDAPGHLAAVPSDHSGVGPFARSRHWNLGLEERFEDGSEIATGSGAECAGNVLPDGEVGVLVVGGMSQLPDEPDALGEQARALVLEASP